MSITLEDRGHAYLDCNYKMGDEEGLPLKSFSFKTEADQFNRLKSLLSITKEVYYIEAYQIDTEGVHGRWNVVVMADDDAGDGEDPSTLGSTIGDISEEQARAALHQFLTHPSILKVNTSDLPLPATNANVHRLVQNIHLRLETEEASQGDELQTTDNEGNDQASEDTRPLFMLQFFRYELKLKDETNA